MLNKQQQQNPWKPGTGFLKTNKLQVMPKWLSLSTEYIVIPLNKGGN